MKKRNVLSFFSVGALTQTPAFLFLTAIFLCGAAAGSLTGVISTSRGVMLSFELPEERNALFLLFGTLLWLVGAVLAGLLPPGGLFISAVVAARAFILSFSVAAMLGKPAWATIWLSLKAFGLQAVVTVPCLLVTAAAAFNAGIDQPRGMKHAYWYALRRYRSAVLVSFLLSAASVPLRFLP